MRKKIEDDTASTKKWDNTYKHAYFILKKLWWATEIIQHTNVSSRIIQELS